MGVTYMSSLSKLNSDVYLRLDYKYHSVNDFVGWNIFQSKSNNLVSFKDIFFPFYKAFNFEEEEEYKGIPTGREYLNEFGDIISYQSISKDDHPNRLKYFADSDCLLISSLRGAKTPALNFDYDLSNYVFSNGFYIFKIKDGWSKKFLLYLLRIEKLKYLLDNNIYRGIGISAYKEEDFLKIQIPIIPIEIQNQVAKQIEPIEKEIANLKNSKVKEIDIINNIIGNELNFNWNEFEKLKAIHKFDGSITNFSNNIDCRFSYKFHNKAGEYLTNYLLSKTDKKIKHFLSEPIVLGKGVSPSDYDEDGDYYYIGMSNIKTWYFIAEDCKKVNDSYSSANQNKTVRMNDIILARSGEGTIGKVALIEDEDIKGIFADFTQRIRLKDYNPHLAYYYFRSDIFQYLVYTHKKGLGNNTNIFPNQIQEFPIPDWSIEKQKEIADKIKSEIDIQNEIDIQITEKQNEISKLIETTIDNSK